MIEWIGARLVEGFAGLLVLLILGVIAGAICGLLWLVFTYPIIAALAAGVILIFACGVIGRVLLGP